MLTPLVVTKAEEQVKTSTPNTEQKLMPRHDGGTSIARTPPGAPDLLMEKYAHIVPLDRPHFVHTWTPFILRGNGSRSFQLG